MSGLTREEAREVARDLPAIEAAVGSPCGTWANRCHEISREVLRTGLFGPGRVARGSGRGMRGQHSWIVLGENADVYAMQAVVVDPTIWWTEPEMAPYVWTGRNRLAHHPHGAGNIWTQGGPPPNPEGELVELKGYDELSREARAFLADCGYPLDYRGWAHIAHSPMEGWPAGEIIAAMCDTTELAAIPPIDIVGMVTPRNPKGLYW